MSKRKYTHMQEYSSTILTMRNNGYTNQEVADFLGLEYEQVQNFIRRHNRKERMLAPGCSTKPKGRPRKDGQPPRQDPQKELERLRMENKLLRDFLQSTERM